MVAITASSSLFAKKSGTNTKPYNMTRIHTNKDKRETLDSD